MSLYNHLSILLEAGEEMHFAKAKASEYEAKYVNARNKYQDVLIGMSPTIMSTLQDGYAKYVRTDRGTYITIVNTHPSMGDIDATTLSIPNTNLSLHFTKVS